MARRKNGSGGAAALGLGVAAGLGLILYTAHKVSATPPQPPPPPNGPPPPPGDVTVAMDHTEFETGQVVAITGEGFDPGEEVIHRVFIEATGTQIPPPPIQYEVIHEHPVTADAEGDVYHEFTIMPPLPVNGGEYFSLLEGQTSGKAGFVKVTIWLAENGDPTPEPSVSVPDFVFLGDALPIAIGGFHGYAEVEITVMPEETNEEEPVGIILADIDGSGEISYTPTHLGVHGVLAVDLAGDPEQVAVGQFNVLPLEEEE